MDIQNLKENAAECTAGSQLRVAREKMGLTPQQVAARLCLKLSTVKDIEEDRFPADLSSTFWRGYLRSYARLVRLPEANLYLGTDDKRILGVHPLPHMAKKQSKRHREGSNHILLIFTTLIILTVFGLSALWWWKNYQASQKIFFHTENAHNAVASIIPSSLKENNEPPIKTNSSVKNNSEDTSPAIIQDVNKSVLSLIPETQSMGSSLEKNAKNVTKEISPSKAPDIISVNKNLNNNPKNDTANALSNSVKPVQPSSLPVSNETPVTSSENKDEIFFSFTGDCWVEVTDAMGKKRYRGLRYAGENFIITGVAPYRLKIGAPAAAQIQYNGKPVDLNRFILSGRVANITLGKEGEE